MGGRYVDPRLLTSIRQSVYERYLPPATRDLEIVPARADRDAASWAPERSGAGLVQAGHFTLATHPERPPPQWRALCR